VVLSVSILDPKLCVLYPDPALHRVYFRSRTGTDFQKVPYSNLIIYSSFILVIFKVCLQCSVAFECILFKSSLFVLSINQEHCTFLNIFVEFIFQFQITTRMWIRNLYSLGSEKNYSDSCGSGPKTLLSSIQI
jgi:hypothetical protein